MKDIGVKILFCLFSILLLSNTKVYANNLFDIQPEIAELKMISESITEELQLQNSIIENIENNCVVEEEDYEKLKSDLEVLENYQISEIISKEEYDLIVKKLGLYAKQYETLRKKFYKKIENIKIFEEPEIAIENKTIYDTIDETREHLNNIINNNQKLIENNGSLNDLLEAENQISNILNSLILLSSDIEEIIGNKNLKVPTTEDLKPLNQKVVDYALTFVGNKYKYGAANPNTGTDCSGFVMYVYKHFGYNLPRSTSAQWSWAKKNKKIIKLSQARAGDIVMYSGHVGILIDDGHTMVHASNSSPYPKGGIKISKVYKKIKGIIRVIN